MLSPFTISCVLAKRRARPLTADLFLRLEEVAEEPVEAEAGAGEGVWAVKAKGAEEKDMSDDDDDSTGFSQGQAKYKLKDHGPKIGDLKELIRLISEQDKLDLVRYAALDPDQKRVIDAIFNKRYKSEILAEIPLALAQNLPTLDTYKFLQPKRMDHCEKSSMSIKLGLVKETFISTEYGKRRPKDLRDDINRTIFKKYFHDCINPDQKVEVSKGSGEDEKTSEAEMMVRRSAIFCMKKGLTKCWFKSISSKFLNLIMKISVDQVKKYYFDRFLIKLDEIFGNDAESMDGYYDRMLTKINSKKFKLPLTSKELEKCEEKATKKIRKLKVNTIKQEEEDFRAAFGEEWKTHHETWLNEQSTPGGSVFADSK